MMNIDEIFMGMPEGISTLVISQPYCKFCDKAKNILVEKNIPFLEYCVGIDLTKEEASTLTGMNTRPAIYINGELIGGYTQLLRHLTS
jgi:glutaredoxin